MCIAPLPKNGRSLRYLVYSAEEKEGMMRTVLFKFKSLQSVSSCICKLLQSTNSYFQPLSKLPVSSSFPGECNHGKTDNVIEDSHRQI